VSRGGGSGDPFRSIYIQPVSTRQGFLALIKSEQPRHEFKVMLMDMICYLAVTKEYRDEMDIIDDFIDDPLTLVWSHLKNSSDTK